MKVLSRNSKVIESWLPNYMHPVEVLPKYQPKGYILRYPFFIQGSRDAYVHLSTSETPSVDDENTYEIQIGALGNTQHQLTRKINGKLFAQTRESRVLSGYTPTKFVIEITSDGHIRVFSSKSPYAPLLEAYDPSPVPVKYINFASGCHVHFYHDVDEPTIMAKKDKWPIELGMHLPVWNPLIVNLTLTPETEDICKFDLI